MSGKENANPNSYLFNQPKISKELRAHQYTRDRNPLCTQHGQEIGRYFCYDCLLYNLCSKCFEVHEGHKIRKFANANQAKQQTKQVLLIQVEGTLNRLKGRQNELKNQIEQISLIKNRLRYLSDEIINTVKQQLEQLEVRVNEKLKVQFDKYQKQLDLFYRQYNNVNDYLRQNLLKIIDAEINILTFNKNNVCKDIDLKFMPQFGKIKLVMEKCKKYLKNVKQSTKQLENSIKFFSNQEEKSQIKYEKYDKFLKEKTYNEECSAPLMRTLSILENNQPDLHAIRMKLRT